MLALVSVDKVTSVSFGSESSVSVPSAGTTFAALFDASGLFVFPEVLRKFDTPFLPAEDIFTFCVVTLLDVAEGSFLISCLTLLDSLDVAVFDERRWGKLFLLGFLSTADSESTLFESELRDDVERIIPFGVFTRDFFIDILDDDARLVVLDGSIFALEGAVAAVFDNSSRLFPLVAMVFRNGVFRWKVLPPVVASLSFVFALTLDDDRRTLAVADDLVPTVEVLAKLDGFAEFVDFGVFGDSFLVSLAAMRLDGSLRWDADKDVLFCDTVEALLAEELLRSLNEEIESDEVDPEVLDFERFFLDFGELTVRRAFIGDLDSFLASAVDSDTAFTVRGL